MALPPPKGGVVTDLSDLEQKDLEFSEEGELRRGR
jgi:hypothetical protein